MLFPPPFPYLFYFDLISQNVISSVPKIKIEKSFPLVHIARNLWGMGKMNIDGENLVSLDQWKTQKREGNFSDYLKVLSFNDLMNESDSLMDQLKRSEEMDDLFSKTRVMMNEFTNRLERESKHLADSVKDLKKQIEDKLH